MKPLAPTHDFRSAAHPTVAKKLHAIYALMGFTSIDDFDAFWAATNKKFPPDIIESAYRENLIYRAMSGEAVDTKAIYRARESAPPNSLEPIGLITGRVLEKIKNGVPEL